MIQPSHTEKQLLDSLRNARPTDETLRRCRDEERCMQLFRAILMRAARHLRNGATVMDSLLQQAMLDVPDPERLLVQLDRLLEASFSPAGLLDHFHRTPELLSRFARLTAASRWIADTLVRDAGLFRWLLTTDVLEDRPSRYDLAERAAGSVRRFDQPAKRMNALRRFQRRELLRIAAADILGFKDIHRVMEELSGLADAVVDLAWREARTIIEQRSGAPLRARCAILALGKLGGNELNYSSDIDLMWVYEEGDAREHEHVVAAVKECVRILTESTPEGMLYRTDLRLRPDGGAGALALSLPATLAYYESRGALWERQMLLRARICTDDDGFGREVLTALAPFVYPRTALTLPSDLTADVARRLAERWVEDRNVKHMQGGIRQIEFSLQILQMIHAPRKENLRTPSTLDSIDRLTASDLLTLEEEALLRQAYLFLRRVEHALQLESFEQTHTLSEGADELRRIAWAMKFDEAEAFEQKLDDIRSDVHRICSGMLGQSTEEITKDMLTMEMFEDAENARRLLPDLLEGRSSRPHGTALRTHFEALKAELLSELADTSLPDLALTTLEHLVHRTAAPDAVRGLLQQPPSRRMLLKLAASAPVALRMLETDPLALELVFTGYDITGLSSQRLQRITTVGALGSWLHGDASLDDCSARLTETADTILARSLGDLQPGEPDFVVVAMGKYGGRELIPGSDLDVVFLFDGDEEGAQETAQAMARRVIAAGQEKGDALRLYEVDARLRPEGRNAPLAVSRQRWLRYFADRASLWEKQSLLRARVAAGTPDLGARIMEDIRGIHAACEVGESTIQTVREMRLNMEPRSRFRQEDVFDIKRSPGGLVDTEFAVQLLCLAQGISQMGPTTLAIERLRELEPGLQPQLERMRGAYEMLRQLQLLFRMLLDVPGNMFPTDEDQRRRLARVMGHADGAALLGEVQKCMRQNRLDFESVCEHLSSHDD